MPSPSSGSTHLLHLPHQHPKICHIMLAAAMMATEINTAGPICGDALAGGKGLGVGVLSWVVLENADVPVIELDTGDDVKALLE